MSSFASRLPNAANCPIAIIILAAALLLFWPGAVQVCRADLTPPDKMITLDLEGMQFENFVRIIAEFSQYNIVAYDKAEKPVTFKAAELPWSRALDIALQSQEMTKLIDGNVIRIFRTNRLPQMVRRPPGFYSGRLISLDLQDTDIENALRIIEEVSNKQLRRPEPAPDGRVVTLRLIDVPWDQCLDIIAESASLIVERNGDNYSLRSRNNL